MGNSRSNGDSSGRSSKIRSRQIGIGWMLGALACHAEKLKTYPDSSGLYLKINTITHKTFSGFRIKPNPLYWANMTLGNITSGIRDPVKKILQVQRQEIQLGMQH